MEMINLFLGFSSWIHKYPTSTQLIDQYWKRCDCLLQNAIILVGCVNNLIYSIAKNFQWTNSFLMVGWGLLHLLYGGQQKSTCLICMILLEFQMWPYGVCYKFGTREEAMWYSLREATPYAWLPTPWLWPLEIFEIMILKRNLFYKLQWQ